MEINLNCDLGEKSIHYDGKNDEKLLKLVNSANIACGYHAGDKDTINRTIKSAIKNNVSIGAHPGFKDLENFGRKKINLSKKELSKLIIEQLEIINKIAIDNNTQITHVKPHGALNNMACENIDTAIIIGEAIKKFNKELIYVVQPLNKMENAAIKLNLKYACEIFADRHYDDNGQLISRDNLNAIISNPVTCSERIMQMLELKSIICFSGKKIKCNIDTICIHGDEKNSHIIASEVRNVINQNRYDLVNLDNMIRLK